MIISASHVLPDRSSIFLKTQSPTHVSANISHMPKLWHNINRLLLTDRTVLVKLEKLFPLEPAATTQTAKPGDNVPITIDPSWIKLSNLAAPFSTLCRLATALSKEATASSLVSPSALCIIPFASITEAVICEKMLIRRGGYSPTN